MSLYNVGSSFSVLRDWDKATSTGRIQLLQWFRSRFHDARYSDELESECGAEIALLLPRIVVWMDKTIPLSKPLASPTDIIHGTTLLNEQLAVIQLFLTSPYSRKYLREFIQADGLRVLLRIVETDVPPHHCGVSVQHRCLIYRLLCRVVQYDRELKDVVSRAGGELAMVRGVIATIDHSATPAIHLQTRMWMLCRSTLLEQMVGNRVGEEAAYEVLVFMLHHEVDIVRLFGAQILRELINEGSFYFDAQFRQSKQHALVPVSVTLLHSPSIPLQHEGLELVHALLQLPSARKSICALLAQWIHDTAIAADPVEPAFAAMQHSREYEMYIHLRSPFVLAAQSLVTLMHSVPRILPLLVQTHEVLIAMAFVLTVERPQSLKWHAALTAIHFVFGRCRAVAAGHLSQLFVVRMDQLMDLPHRVTPEALADSLLRDDEHRQVVGMHFYRNGWVRAMPPSTSEYPGDCGPIGDNGDVQLRRIEYEVDAAVHCVIPGLPLHVPYEDDTDDDDEHTNSTKPSSTESRGENQLREKLERHFMTYRHFVAPLPPTTT